MFLVLFGADWHDSTFHQLLIDRFVNRASMGIIGLLIMLIGHKMDSLVKSKSIFGVLIFVVSVFFVIITFLLIPFSVYVNHMFSFRSSKSLDQKRFQFELVNQQLVSPQALEELGGQLVQVGQLPINASVSEKKNAARKLVNQQVSIIKQKLQKEQQEYDAARNQKWLGGTVSLLILLVAFICLALLVFA